jgi:hypothetical protein
VRRWALITAVGLVLASHARAQAPLPLSLDWQAPAECPREGDVRAELARITRVRPGHTLTPLVASAVVERVGQGYATRLRTERAGNRGARKLEAGDCGTLVRTVTLVLALAFGSGVELTERAGTNGARLGADTAEPAPASVESPAAESSAAEPASEAPRGPPAVGSVASEPSSTDQDAADVGEATASDLELAFVLGGGAQLGPLPAPGFGLMAGAVLARGAFALELRALAWPTLARAQSAEVSARFDGFGGAALGCGLVPQGAVTLALCAGARVAALRGRSAGASDDAAATAPWYALSAVGALSWPRAGLIRLRLEATLSISLARPYFVIEGLGQAHQIPRLAPELALLLVLVP